MCVDHMIDGIKWRWTLVVSIFLVQYFCMRSTVKTGHMAKYLQETTFIQTEIGDYR